MEPFISTAYDGPQHHDILVAHRGYGDVNEKSNNQQGNDVANLATDLGTVFSGSPETIGEDARTFEVAANATDFVSIDDESDIDFYSFTVDGTAIADITLEALGHTYDIGPQTPNGQQPQTGPFSTLVRSDLALTLFDTDGTTELGSSDLAGFGGIESLTGINLSAGTYFVRISGDDSEAGNIAIDTQFYSLGISVAAVPEPSSLAVVGLLSTTLLLRRRR
jgi:hypothetical protein